MLNQINMYVQFTYNSLGRNRESDVSYKTRNHPKPSKTNKEQPIPAKITQNHPQIPEISNRVMKYFRKKKREILDYTTFTKYKQVISPKFT